MGLHLSFVAKKKKHRNSLFKISDTTFYNHPVFPSRAATTALTGGFNAMLIYILTNSERPEASCRSKAKTRKDIDLCASSAHLRNEGERTGFSWLGRARILARCAHGYAPSSKHSAHCLANEIHSTEARGGSEKCPKGQVGTESSKEAAGPHSSLSGLVGTWGGLWYTVYLRRESCH